MSDEEGISNAFAEHGTLIHSVLEDYANGKLELEQLVDAFLGRFDMEVLSDYPVFRRNQDLREYYRKKFSVFLTKFKGFSGKVVATEKFFEYKLDENSSYRGVIDLITESDEYINLVDFKSGNKFKKKEMLKKSRQLLMYLPAIKDIVDKSSLNKKVRLMFYFLKEGEVVEVEYDDDILQEALDHSLSVIKEIKAETEYDFGLTEENKKTMGFFCNNICSFRNDCKAKKLILKK